MAKLEELTNTEIAVITRADLAERGYGPVLLDLDEALAQLKPGQILVMDEMMRYEIKHPAPQPHSPIQLTEPNSPIMSTGKPRRG